MDMKTILQQNRIIAATEQDNLSLALDSQASAVLLMYGKLINLVEEVSRVDQQNKPIFLHADLIKGLSTDKEAFRFLAKYVKPSGIVTTKSPVIRAAKKEGMLTIQRIFLIDTASFLTAIQNVKDNEPDAIEVMPGIAPSIIQEFKKHVDQPIISAGLIWSKDQVHAAIQAGADAVSLSKPELWNMQF
ncbi:glycerol-3-phosphate responsive antiterminator [Aneurinibacillus sp. Ricciae_BoGa-3]|uniref:glycerol-3-phosphate responsive antiterminator n=1 Tax=Aneurinibacillus sp. Ricciae_BoGa-3 TaxID=3022697 RepID=UPI002340580A|nr:glycerol-3-phosphate responsive antiterminator [Aneurinibacillus sp. Ricciae_BoGa-3]WCK54326.1 glycerol-3-phosphate responsive antiterminator [Aneurinibacillus sp. Ricciae_BoGa-3]